MVVYMSVPHPYHTTTPGTPMHPRPSAPVPTCRSPLVNMVIGLGIRALMDVRAGITDFVLIWPYLIVFVDRFLDRR